MQLNTKRFRIFFAVFAVLAPVAAVIRTVVLFQGVDPETGFFRALSPLSTGLNAVFLALFFASILSGLIRRKNEAKPAAVPVEQDELLMQGQADYEEEPEVIQPIKKRVPLIGVFAVSQTWQGTLSAFAYFLLGFAFLAAAAVFPFYNLRLGESPDALSSFAALFQFLAGGVFLISALRKKAGKSALFSYLSLAPVFYLALRMISEYHNMDHPNKGIYVGQLLFILSALLFFLYQAELSFGHDSYAHPDLYAHFALLTVFFGLTVILPRAVSVLFGDFSLNPLEWAALISDLALAFFAGVKVSSLLRINN